MAGPGLSHYNIGPLQLAFVLSCRRPHSSPQNVAAHLVSGRHQHDYITPVKTACWCGFVCRMQPLVRRLTSGVLLVPHSRTSRFQRSFAVYGPSAWNSLPAVLRSLELTFQHSSVNWRPASSSWGSEIFAVNIGYASTMIDQMDLFGNAKTRSIEPPPPHILDLSTTSTG